MSDDYEQRLSAWMRAHGVPEPRASAPESIPAGELRMIAEDKQSTGTCYCWLCGDEFPIKDMVIEIDPHVQIDDDDEEGPDETGYVKEENRIRKCVACDKRQRDEEAGIEEGQEP